MYVCMYVSNVNAGYDVVITWASGPAVVFVVTAVRTTDWLDHELAATASIHSMDHRRVVYCS